MAELKYYHEKRLNQSIFQDQFNLFQERIKKKHRTSLRFISSPFEKIIFYDLYKFTKKYSIQIKLFKKSQGISALGQFYQVTN